MKLVAREAVGGDEHSTRLHGAPRRLEHMTRPFPAPGDDRAFAVNDSAAPQRCIGKPTAVFERVKAKADRLVHGAIGLGRGIAALGQLGLRPDGGRASAQASQRVGLLLKVLQSRGPMRDGERALPLRIERDAFFRRKITHQLDRLAHRAHATRGLGLAEASRHCVERQPDRAEAAEPAIAPRGAPADRRGLEHARLNAMVAREMIGRGQAGIAAADDRDFGVDIALKRRKPGCIAWTGARRPIALDRLACVIEGRMVERGHGRLRAPTIRKDNGPPAQCRRPMNMRYEPAIRRAGRAWPSTPPPSRQSPAC